MKGPNRRKGESELRSEWTARLNRFAAAKTAKQRQAAIEPALKINPGGAIRGLLEAWGYSASSRGRKAKSARAEPQRKQGREQLEAVLRSLYGKKPAPVPNFNKKLAGASPATVKDACRIVAALVMSWPDDPSTSGGAKLIDASKCDPMTFAEIFIRELLSDLSGGRSHEWAAEEMGVRVFSLIDEERIGASQFIKEAGAKEGALIVAAAKDILIGPHPVETIRQFHNITSEFIGKDRKGLLIFVFDTALFEAGEDGYRILYNLCLLSTAMTAFALFEQSYDYTKLIHQHKVDWSRWKTISGRCCTVIRRPPLVDPTTGEFLRKDRLDEFIAGWEPKQKFETLGELNGFVRFDSSHVLPRTYPHELSTDQDLRGRDLYWDVVVRPAQGQPDGLEVQYYTPPVNPVAPSNDMDIQDQIVTGPRGRGRPPAKNITIEEDVFHVIRRGSPGAFYDDAQRAIYMAARARLHLDSGQRHIDNINAAAALRQIGYEVLPISVMMALFPRSLHFAAAQKLHVQ